MKNRTLIFFILFSIVLKAQDRLDYIIQDTNQTPSTIFEYKEVNVGLYEGASFIQYNDLKNELIKLGYPKTPNTLLSLAFFLETRTNKISFDVLLGNSLIRTSNDSLEVYISNTNIQITLGYNFLILPKSKVKYFTGLNHIPTRVDLINNNKTDLSGKIPNTPTNHFWIDSNCWINGIEYDFYRSYRFNSFGGVSIVASYSLPIGKVQYRASGQKMGDLIINNGGFQLGIKFKIGA